ncbi:hypothetical protein [Rhodococcus qingshengii]|uniref:hypothetical protein n=1 Tax=Rhodococcus qingshengii TaxID=334542 RepID=UPI00287F683B|nr:hypothetical protein [Rhodococcus qingshengii]
MRDDQHSVAVPAELAEYLYQQGFDRPVEGTRDVLQDIETVQAYMESASAIVSSVQNFKPVLVTFRELPNFLRTSISWFRRQDDASNRGAVSSEDSASGMSFAISLSKASDGAQSGRVEWDRIKTDSENEFVAEALTALKKLLADED